MNRRKTLPLCAAFLVAIFLAASVSQASVAAGALGALGLTEAPARVAADAAGNLLVTQPAAGQVTVLNAFGQPVAVHNGFAQPLAIAVDGSGRILLSEAGAGSVSVFDAQWNQLYQLGQGAGEFAQPTHLVVDPASGAVFVCDSGANQIKVYQGGQRTIAFGGPGSATGQFDFPSGVCLSPAGEVLVVDQNNDRVEVFTRGGVFLRAFPLGSGGMGLGTTQSGRSQGVVADAAGNIYVADTFQDLVKVFDAQGNALTTLGGFAAGAGQLRSPTGLAVDRFNRLLVASPNASQVALFGLAGYLHLSVQPSAAIVAAGTTVTLAVAVDGAGPFSFQWFRGAQPLADTANRAGSTAAVLRLTGSGAADSGAYFVTVTGPGGPLSSPSAVLTVLAPPVITAAPTNTSVLRGAPAAFTVGASGDALGYQWFFKGAAIPGATAPSYSIPAAQSADAGSYTVSVSNLVGVVTSGPAALAVVAQPNPPQLDAALPQPDGSVLLSFHADAGFNYTVDASSDLANWTPMVTVYCENGAVDFNDADVASQPQRFYRLRWTQ